MKAAVRHTDFGDARRIFVISDIHGFLNLFDSLLNRVSFSENDALVICGDITEKGHQSLPALRRVMELGKTHRVFVVPGNAELWLTELLIGEGETFRKAWKHNAGAKRWWKWTAFDEMLAEIGFEYSENMDLQQVMPAVRSHFAQEIEFLTNLPTVIETQEYIFVHAALPTGNTQKIENSDIHTLVNTDDFYSSAPEFSKTVVVGHWPVMLSAGDKICGNPIFDRRRNLLCIDGGAGAKKMGQLNLVELPAQGAKKGEISWIYEDNLPKAVALENQLPSAMPKHIVKWTDRFASSAEKISPDMSRITVGKNLIDVPTQLLFDEYGRIACDDFSDERLRINAGDTLSVITQVSEGVYCKHSGTCGWYQGKYQMKDE